MDRKETGAAILVNKVGLFRSKLRRTTACGAEVGRSWRPIEGKPGAVRRIHTGRGTGGETGESTARTPHEKLGARVNLTTGAQRLRAVRPGRLAPVALDFSMGHTSRKGPYDRRHNGPMSERVDLYDSTYGNFNERVLAEIRRETFGDDIGQNSWITTEELETFYRWLDVAPKARVLEVASGSGAGALLSANAPMPHNGSRHPRRGGGRRAAGGAGGRRRQCQLSDRGHGRGAAVRDGILRRCHLHRCHQSFPPPRFRVVAVASGPAGGAGACCSRTPS
mgnify:CR=1 FL=1